LAGPVSAEFLETVRSRIEIVDLVGEYVILKRTGQNYVGLCPFHHEKTPSFTVSPAKQIFYCFGCGVGGNVFTFLMKKDHLSFPESVETLAARLGMEVPRAEYGEVAGRRERDRFYGLNTAVADFYHRALLQEANAQRARDYLKGRGILDGTCEKFKLGYASDNQELREYLLGHDFPPELISEAGLDRFHGRITFPIYDVQGRCLGFGGRTLGNEQPKYLNSSDTRVYSKSHVLYGLNFAVPAVREKGRVLVTEGYLDCITAQQSGFLNVVAALGTAFTHDQARLLSRYTKDVVLAFDTDAAGSSASLRGARYLQELGVRVYVLELPSGKDPDEFLRSQGEGAFAEALEERVTSHLEFRLGQLMKEYDPQTVEGKEEIVNAMFEDLSRISNLVAREGYVRVVCERLGVSEDALRSELVRYMTRQQVKKVRIDKNRYNMEQGKQTFAKPKMTAPEAARRGLFRFMCQDRKVWERVRQEIGLAVFQGKLRHYLELMDGERCQTPGELLNLVGEDEQGDLANLLLAGEDESDRQVQALMVSDYLRVLKKEQLNQKIDQGKADLAICEKNNDLAGIKTLLAELHRLFEELESSKKISQ
jgi:DNA primase